MINLGAAIMSASFNDFLGFSSMPLIPRLLPFGKQASQTAAIYVSTNGCNQTNPRRRLH